MQMWYKKKKNLQQPFKSSKNKQLFFFSPDSIIEIPTLRKTATGLRSGNLRPAQICQLGLKVQKNDNVHQVQLNGRDVKQTRRQLKQLLLLLFSHFLEDAAYYQ